jgi:hypothetical protein
MTSRETRRIPAPRGIRAPALQSEIDTAQGDLTDELVDTDVWSDSMLIRAGIPIIDAPLVTIGGGIGSFVFVDYLRIAGVPRDKIRVLTNIDHPWQTYQYLTRVSQIPQQERLRSDSASCPDNIWGFPSYALREAFSRKRLKDFLAPLWQVATEPILSDYYTPKAGHVFRGLAAEADRVDFSSMQIKGLVRMVRKRDGGGYFSLLTPPQGTSATKRVAYRSTYVHLAVGYPGLRFLPDLQDYRQRYQDFSHIVNAYEPHEQVYEELLRHSSTVIVRGAGIVASRVLQRIIDDREQHGAQTTIVHLFRTYVTGAHGPNAFLRRRGGQGWAYQGFNYPKSAWGGQLKQRMRKLEGKDRADLYDVIGGTTTPHRRSWMRQLKRGRREGFYRTYTGQVEELVPGPDGSVVTRIATADGVLEIPARYVIDATGLEADIRDHRLLADLLDHAGAGRNPLDRLNVERTFEVRGTRNGGRIYAVGAATLGGYFPGVDTFLGLQIAAQEICDDLARAGFCQKIGVARSAGEWLRWVRNEPPRELV